jgi:hypothetical protein
MTMVVPVGDVAQRLQKARACRSAACGRSWGGGPRRAHQLGALNASNHPMGTITSLPRSETPKSEETYVLQVQILRSAVGENPHEHFEIDVRLLGFQRVTGKGLCCIKAK